MPVYKIYFKILWKLKKPILIYTILFITLTYLLTASTEIGSSQYEVSKVKTMVINEEIDSSFVQGFLDYLDQYITVIEPGKDENAMKDALFFGEAQYILTIPKGFTESFLNAGNVKLMKESVPNSVDAMSLDHVIDNYFNMASVYLKHVPQLSYDKLNEYLKDNLKDETQIVFNVEKTDDITYANEFNQFYYNFLGYILVAAYITGISMIIYAFNGIDIRRRHTASPMSYKRFNFQLILSNLVFAFGFLLLFIIAGFMLNKSRIINSNLLMMWLNAALFSITILSLSYLIGITVNNRKTIGVLSTALSVGLSFLSGIFVPQQYLGGSVLKVASFLPAYWYVKGNDILVNLTSYHWNDLSEVFACMAVQLGFTAAIISIALVISKRKRQQAY